ncbi:GGDEF domain-containing protein [Lacticaseibacillus zhaodongensis]|uniref:GGDEF domain-containing protein n=1 Tax=Lacticaseibacillus zhaodongensis TaxID=2668065 RepID=UPI0012D2A1BC|nr:GGDEF domain-containing protein [Lacticaseibacillus zhaodongensis]
MIQQALGYFFLTVASTLGFITVYSQVDTSARKIVAAKRNLNPLNREQPVIIYISALLILLRIIGGGFGGHLLWLLINLQVIILVYSNLLMPTIRAFVIVQAVAIAVFASTGMMNWLNWLLMLVSGAVMFAVRWYGPHFKNDQYIYVLPAGVIGVAFWTTAAVRFPQMVSPGFAAVNALSFIWSFFALGRYDRDQRADQRIIAQLTHETQYDGLTRVRNWTTFQQDFNDKFNSTDQLALIAFDIDHFKSINDTYGHLVGNQALMVVVSTLQKYLRAEYPAGHVYRTGGEEFAIILPDTDRQRATAIVLACEELLRSMPIRYSQGEFHMSASFGLALASGHKIGDATAMFKRADHYLYQSKRAGRNSVTIEGITMSAMRNPSAHASDEEA